MMQKKKERTEAVVLAADGGRRAITERQYPHRRRQTQPMISTYQDVPERPMTESGEQVRPMGTLTPCKTTPRRPRRSEVATLLDDETLLQHWTLPVLHWLTAMAVAVAVAVTVMVVFDGGGAPPGKGVATARTGNASAAARVANFMMKVGGFVVWGVE